MKKRVITSFCKLLLQFFTIALELAVCLTNLFDRQYLAVRNTFCVWRWWSDCLSVFFLNGIVFNLCFLSLWTKTLRNSISAFEWFWSNLMEGCFLLISLNKLSVFLLFLSKLKRCYLNISNTVLLFFNKWVNRFLIKSDHKNVYITWRGSFSH